MNDRRFLSRKWRLAVGVLLLAWISFLVGFRWNVFTAAQLLEFTQWVVGLYMAGNVGDSVASLWFARSSSLPPSP